MATGAAFGATLNKWAMAVKVVAVDCGSVGLPRRWFGAILVWNSNLSQRLGNHLARAW